MASVSQNLSSIEVTNLDHLGIVAGLVDEIGLVKQINELVGEQPGEKVSPGHAVKAMILNGLGLFSSPLYLFPSPPYIPPNGGERGGVNRTLNWRRNSSRTLK